MTASTTLFFSGIFTESLRFGGNDSVLDFFLGTVKKLSDSFLLAFFLVLNVFHCRPNISLCPQGYLDRSPVFFGFYTPSTQKLGCVSTPLLYLAGIFSILLFSLILEVRRSGPQSVLREEMLPFKVKPLTFRFFLTGQRSATSTPGCLASVTA